MVTWYLKQDVTTRRYFWHVLGLAIATVFAGLTHQMPFFWQ